MFNSTSKLNPDNPIDRAILNLIKEELVTIHYDQENKDSMVSLTEKGMKLLNEMKEAGLEPKPSSELTTKDKSIIEKFLKKSR